MSHTSNLRQAAVLLSALSKPQLAAILKRLSPVQAAKVTDQLGRLSGVDTAEFNRSVRQFIDFTQAAGRAATQPTNSPNEPNEPASALHTAQPISLDRDRSLTTDNSLTLLEELPLDRCLELLQGEEAAFLAAVLFLVSAKRCAEIVERMEFGNRARVLRELATVSEISVATIDHIRRQLQRKMEFGSSIHARPEGMHRVRQILEHLDPALQGTIADSLAASDPTLAAELHRNVFRFNDLLRLGRADIKNLLQHVDTAWWAPALRHADLLVRKHIFSAMAAAAAKILTDELAALDELPIDLSISRQSQIVQALQNLFRQRIISRPRIDSRAATAA